MKDEEKYLEKKERLIRSAKRKGYISHRRFYAFCMSFSLSGKEVNELRKELSSLNIELVADYIAWIRETSDKEEQKNKCFFVMICKMRGQEISLLNYDEDKISAVVPLIENLISKNLTDLEKDFIYTYFGLSTGVVMEDSDEILMRFNLSIKEYVGLKVNTIKKLKAAGFEEVVKNAIANKTIDSYQVSGVTSGEKDCVLFSPYSKGKPVAGPVIMQTVKEDYCTDIGYVTHFGQFDYSFSIYKPDGKSAAIIFYNDDKEPRPEIFICEEYISFGVYYPKVGYHGNLYTLKNDKPIKIHHYQSGKEVASTETSTYAMELPCLVFNFPEILKGDVKVEKNKDGTIYFAPNANYDEAAAVKFFDDGRVIMGRSDKVCLNGTCVEFINDKEIEIKNGFNGSGSPFYAIRSNKETKTITFTYLKGDDSEVKFIFDPSNGFNSLTKIETNVRGEEESRVVISNPEWNTIKTKKTRQKDDRPSIERLNDLIGLNNIKRMISRLKAFLVKNKDSEIKPNLNMFFTGCPGTGKTEVARLLAGILYESGITKEDKFVEVDRSGLIGEFIGQSESITNKVISKALGGVLFIDEAYSLFSSMDDKKDYGAKVLDLLVKAMEDHKGEICIIFAGYKEAMENLYKMNQGLASRINRKLDFPNYDLGELRLIAQKFLKDNDYKITDEALNEIMDIMETKISDKNFANAREVRNVLEYCYEIQAERTLEDFENRTIELCDVQLYETENHIVKVKKEKKPQIKIDLDLVKKVSSIQKNFNFDKQFVFEASVNIKIFDKEGKNVVSEGSGFFITPNGLIATCAHVIKDAEYIKVVVNIPTSKGKNITQQYTASVVGLNEKTDCGLIQLDNVGDYEFTYYQIEDGNKIPTGLEEVVMGGYPLGGERFAKLSLNEGKVQSYNKDSALGEEANQDKIYVDLTGSAGNSGSGVIDKLTGKCIGIYAGASLGYSSSVQFQLNFAIPTKYLWDLLKKCAK